MTDRFVYKLGVKAGQILGRCFFPAKDLQAIKLHYPVFQTIRAVELVIYESGILMVFYDHMKQDTHSITSF